MFTRLTRLSAKPADRCQCVRYRQGVNNHSRTGSGTIKQNLSKHGKLTMFILLLIFIGIFSSSRANAQPIGINLAEIRYYSPELVFNDIFKRASQWESVNASKYHMKSNKQPLQIDRNGWVERLSPGQWAMSYLFADFGGHLPQGRYKCLYKGKGKMRFDGAVILDQGKGWIELELKPEHSYVRIVIERTDPENYIRNIRILPLDDKGKIIKSTFRAGFLKRWKGFKALRFMDWMDTNHTKVSRWSDRVTKTYFSQATKGVALEYMIELANTLKISPWFCIPYKADDEYVRNFARMVKTRLDPSLECYVEYSNEVWNSMFPASRYAKRMGLKLGFPNDDGQAGVRFYAHRSVQIFKIWENVFGGTGRFYRVLSSQASWPDRVKKTLDWENAYQHADALAIAPYFDLSSKDFKHGFLATLHNVFYGKPTLDDVFSLLQKKIDDKKSEFATYHKMATARRLQLIAYEGGQSLLSKDHYLRKLYLQANRDPRMYSLYQKYLNYWFQNGGGLINQYNSISRYTKWGYWGSLEWYDQPVSPTSKYAALVDELNSH